MSSARTPSRWPYRAAKPVRTKRVVKTNETPRGVQRKGASLKPVMTPKQARLALGGVLAVALLATVWWLYQSPYMTVHEVRVVGASQLSEQDVRGVAAVDGQSAFRLDARAAEQRLEALPLVRSAKVEQHGWTSATITVEERKPWGSWQINRVNVPIDVDGYVLEQAHPAKDAPVIVEVDPQRPIKPGDRLDAGAIQLADRLVRESQRAFGRSVVTFAYRQNAGLTVVLSGADVDGARVWVTFGDSRDYDYKVAALYVLLQQAQQANVRVSAVDLRFGSRMSFN